MQLFHLSHTSPSPLNFLQNQAAIEQLREENQRLSEVSISCTVLLISMQRLVQLLFLTTIKCTYMQGKERKSIERRTVKSFVPSSISRYNDTYIAHAPQSLLYRPVARIFRKGDTVESGYQAHIVI